MLLYSLSLFSFIVKAFFCMLLYALCLGWGEKKAKLCLCHCHKVFTVFHLWIVVLLKIMALSIILCIEYHFASARLQRIYNHARSVFLFQRKTVLLELSRISLFGQVLSILIWNMLMIILYNFQTVSVSIFFIRLCPTTQTRKWGLFVFSILQVRNLRTGSRRRYHFWVSGLRANCKVGRFPKSIKLAKDRIGFSICVFWLHTRPLYNTMPQFNMGSKTISFKFL